MSASSDFERLRRNISRLRGVVNMKTTPYAGPTEILDFDVGFPNGSMGDPNGRASEILGSTITVDTSTGKATSFLIRLPPVTSELYTKTELRDIVEPLVDDAPLEGVRVEIEPDSIDQLEWTPHVRGREWPPYEDLDAIVQMLREVYQGYEEAVYDEDIAGVGGANVDLEAPSPTFQRRLEELAFNVTLNDQGRVPRYTFRLDIDDDAQSGLGMKGGVMPVEQNIPSNLSVDSGSVSGSLRPPNIDQSVGSKDAVEQAIRDIVDLPSDAMEVRLKRFNPTGYQTQTWRPHLVMSKVPTGAAIDAIEALTRELRPALERLAGAGGSDADLAAPAIAQEADLFHITRRLDAESIARNGLQRRSMNRTEKIARDATGEIGQYEDSEPFMEEPADVQADRRFDRLIADARREVDRSLPMHDSNEAVFFWADESRATRAATDRGGPNEVVVAVDSRKLPTGCDIVKGDISITDAVYTRIREAASQVNPRPLSREEEDELFETAVDYWEQVQPYTYAEGEAPFSKAEVWTNCDVPPEAIEAIYLPASDRVLYDPADADQRTLREFEAARR